MLYQSFRSLFNERLSIFVCPSVNFDENFHYVCEKLKLHQASKIVPRHFITTFYVLLYIRVFPQTELSNQLVAMLSNFHLPSGFQKWVSFFPLRGVIYNYKGMSIFFELDNSIKNYVEKNFHNGSILSDISYLSRELVLNKTSLKEKFNESLIFGSHQAFVLNSFFVYEDKKPALGSIPNEMMISNANVEINVSVAVSLLFGFYCNVKDVTSFTGLAGCIGKIEFDKESFSQNIRSCLDIMLKPVEKDNFNGDKREEPKKPPINKPKEKPINKDDKSEAVLNANKQLSSTLNKFEERVKRLEGTVSKTKPDLTLSTPKKINRGLVPELV